MAVSPPTYMAPETSISAHPAGMASAGVAKVEAGIMQVFEISMESQLTINTRMSEIK